MHTTASYEWKWSGKLPPLRESSNKAEGHHCTALSIATFPKTAIFNHLVPSIITKNYGDNSR